jgi:hypothetical protein
MANFMQIGKNEKGLATSETLACIEGIGLPAFCRLFKKQIVGTLLSGRL